MTPRMNTEPLYLALSTLLQRHWALSKKYETGAPDMADHCMEEAQRLVRDHLPSGSGFNQGTTLDPERCRTTKLMFLTAFQHMDAAGGYEGWTSHSVKVNPLFGGLNLTVTGKNHDGIKSYIDEVFYAALMQPVEYAPNKP